MQREIERETRHESLKTVERRSIVPEKPELSLESVSIESNARTHTHTLSPHETKIRNENESGTTPSTNCTSSSLSSSNPHRHPRAVPKHPIHYPPPSSSLELPRLPREERTKRETSDETRGCRACTQKLSRLHGRAVVVLGGPPRARTRPADATRKLT